WSASNMAISGDSLARACGAAAARPSRYAMAATAMRMSAVAAMNADVLQKFLTRARIFAERTGHLAGDHGHAALVDAAGGHAFVAGVDDHGHTQWFEVFLNALRNLRGEFFLYLEASRETVDHACQFADADHPL